MSILKNLKQKTKKMKKIRNKIDGVLLLDKPLGLSSNQAIQKVKWILNAEKVGHTGTLDPLATGLLPICLGQATKFAGYLLDGDKEYIATAQLGVITDSGDSEGNLVETRAVDTDLERVLSAFKHFTGEIVQIPPMYSALKHNGRPLYEYARAGIEIERPARNVTIHSLYLDDYNPQLQQITFTARVSKGTYIRTLAEDIGNLLGCGASLIALRRTKTNQFQMQDTITLDDLAAKGLDPQQLLAVDVLTEELKPYELTDTEFAAVKFGNIAPSLQNQYPLNQEYRLYFQQHFLGVGYFNAIENQIFLHPKRLISGLSTLIA